jgi:hypothetical protein
MTFKFYIIGLFDCKGFISVGMTIIMDYLWFINF